MGVKLIAALWGFAEATLFFLVPDIWLSIVGRNHLKTGMVACLYSLSGALVGGVVLYLWGRSDLAAACHVIEKVPAISPDMIARVHSDLSSHGLLSVLVGPLKGTPYKIYAIQAGGAGTGIWPFILVSIPARLIRFILVTCICHYLLKFIGRFDRSVPSLSLLIIGWIIFYSFYFYVVPGK